MKLIRCTIENFGGLSRYTVEFQPGVTVIQAPNGFGKTTLAEFIRAMFYGFPRAGKTLEKNSRKKYSPWQGGKYGGTLVFEHNGKQYRVDRTFGETPRQDTFALYDAQTCQRCTDFSENIGLELFQLDAESFERSTYMPQAHDRAGLTTASIQAKLGDLVEDTNDINNFDKAVAALRAKRSAYIPFRGSGGAVAEAQEHISQLQLELNGADQLYAALEGAQQEAEEQAARKEHQLAALSAIRDQITQASQATAQQALTQQYESLKRRQARTADALAKFSQKYPAGVPTLSELEQLKPLYDQVLALDSQIVQTAAVQEAEAVVEANAQRFASGVPTDDQLRQQQDNDRALVALRSQMNSAGLSEHEKGQLAELDGFFHGSVPDEDFLACCQRENDELKQLRHRQAALQLSDQEDAQLKSLQVYFSAGLPTEEALQQKQAALKRANDLRAENVRLASAQVRQVQDAPAQGRKKSPWAILALALGAALILAGVVMLTGQLYAPGGACLGIGAAALLAAVYLSLKQALANELSANRQGASALSDGDRAQIQANQLEIGSLEESVLSFVSAYAADGRSLADKLLEIQSKRGSYIALAEKRDNNARQADLLARQMGELTDRLTDRLRPYFGQIGSLDDHILLLRTKKAQLEGLLQKQADTAAAAQELQQTAQELTGQISAFLAPYCGQVAPDRFGQQLAALQRERDGYQNARKLLEEQAEQQARRDSSLRQCEDAIRALGERYALALDGRDRAQFQALCDDGKSCAELILQLQKDEAEAAQFYGEHEAVLQSPTTGEAGDLDGLKHTEQQLSQHIAQLSQTLLELEQTVRRLQDQADRIPEKQDELELWMQKKADGIRNSSMLDQTIQFLQKAKDSLSNSYLGAIKESFAGYLARMTGEAAENIVVSPSLDVQVERLGQPREMTYFSAGQSDIIILCMRLALVDALFKDTKPFVVLDDPFVNLDDAHTQQALGLLADLGSDHQVIYLVCNSSRIY